jgi:hypothetical protein
VAALAALAAPAWAKKKLKLLGVAAADNCTWVPSANGLEIELSAVTLAQSFAEAPRREAASTSPADLAAAFTMRRLKKLKNVAVTAWDSTGDVASAAPIYFVGALAGAEAGAIGASMRLSLEQSVAQAQASKIPPPAAAVAGGARPARFCSVFFDSRRRPRRRPNRPTLYAPYIDNTFVDFGDGPIPTIPTNGEMVPRTNPVGRDPRLDILPGR